MDIYSSEPKLIVRKLKESRGEIFSLIKSISNELWDLRTNNDWSIKEIILHIYGWDILLLNQAKLWIKGFKPENLNIDEDKYNAKIIGEYEHKSMEEIIELLNQSTTEIINFLEALNKEEIEYAINNESLVDLDLYSHDIQHLKDINQIISISQRSIKEI